MLIQQGKTRIKKNDRIKKVLVIGPNGNVGSQLIPELLQLGYQVRALEFRSKVEQREGLEVVKGNTLDPESLEKAIDGVDAVCNMIRAFTGPGSTDCEQWCNCAVRGTVNLLEAAKEVKLARFIAGSVDLVFGITEPQDGSINENSPKHAPKSGGYYGLFKIAEEEILWQYYRLFGIPIVITRFPLIWTKSFAEIGCGVGVVFDREKKEIIKSIDVHGKPLVRHDVHVEDAVQGILLALQKDEAVGEDFNIAASDPYSSSEVCEVLHQKYEWVIEERETDWHSWTIDGSKARSVLGYEPQVNLLSWLKSELELI